MNIKVRKLVRMTAAIGTLIVLGLVTPAQADYVIDCGGDYEGLHNALAELDFKNEKDFFALDRKLTEAEDKDGAGKSCDAATKLREFQSKIGKLLTARKPKIYEPHARTLECLSVGSDTLINELDPIIDANSGERACDTYERPKGPKNK